MTALIIIASIALVLALLLSTKIILRIRYEETLTVYLRVLFIKIPLYPKKDKKKRYPHSMSRRKARKIKESLTKKKKKPSKSSKKKKDSKEKPEKKEKNDLLSILSIIISFVKYFLRVFLKSVRVKVAKLQITVATEEAGKTAVLYGAVSQSVNTLIPLLENIKNFKKLPKGNDLMVDADFLLDKSTIKTDITLYVRVGSALKAIIGAAVKSFKKAVATEMEKLEKKNKR